MSASPNESAPRVGVPEDGVAADPGNVRPRTSPPRFRPLPEGPLLVEGPAEIVMPDGSVILCERPVMALCTCRRSLRAPFCDTSHRPRLRAGAGTSAKGAARRAPRGPTEEAETS
ncbi:CDGSH iron-sulfur domain-containing protein [Streptomyces sp. NRRL B-24572]|uniref:CDGSH iron-sulfur domain-containing protein n=1 Tax=Streptomyces sp. NRRL B-24572 TaxID=1962156 RepID=UPI000A3A970E|nr:CDGSH iron-sulfur domain-containing protein [Streptomyces sp. NRRL B-24572]